MAKEVSVNFILQGLVISLKTHTCMGRGGEFMLILLVSQILDPIFS